MAIAFILAFISSKSLIISVLAVVAILVQFVGYGYGFLKSTLAVKLFKANPANRFPKLFFKDVQ